MRHMKMKTIKIINKVFFSIAIGLGIATTPVAADDYELLNLVTVGEGLQRVTHEALLAQGVNLSGLRHDRIVLKSAGESIPLFSVGRLLEDGSHSLYFGDGAYIEYYVTGANSMYTDEQVVGLYVGTSRVDVDVVDADVTPGTSVATSYNASAVYDANVNYVVGSPDIDDPWSMHNLYAVGRPATHEIDIELPGMLSSGEVSVSFEVWGQGGVDESPDHRVDLQVNGSSILPEIAEFEFYDIHEMQGTLDAADLLASGNSVAVHLPLDQGAPYDLIALNRLEIVYPRNLEAINGNLVFTANADAVSVAGLNSADAGVFEVLEDGSQKKLRAEAIDQLDGSFTVQFETTIGGKYFVASGGTPVTVEVLSEDEDISSGSAEYLVIAHESFINEELDVLVNHRQSRYSTKVVNVAQIYSQFGNSRPDPNRYP
jgi:hypothetical protein